MNRTLAQCRSIVLSFLIALGCGCSDGGVGGSGISGSATIQGNVEDITAGGSTAMALGGGAGFAGVWVGVQGTDVSDVTGDDGSFVLVGAIAGDRVLEFRDSRLSEPSTLNVTVLDGSITSLKDVRIRGVRAAADEVRVNNVEMILDSDADCTADGGSVDAHGTGPNGWTVTVLLQSDTLIQRVSASGAVPIACADLTRGSQVNVRGVLTAPREITADVINRTKSGPARH